MKDIYLDHYKDSIAFHKQKQARAPRPLLLKTLNLFGNYVGRAIELGCGSGSDTIKLLESGWSVCAVDAIPNGFENIKSKISSHQLSQVEFRQEYFENLTMSVASADLIYSNLSIPFCRPERFDEFWTEIIRAINVDGRFAGNLFGDKDDWADRTDTTFKTKEQVYHLFRDFELEYFDEILKHGQVGASSVKQWHIFEVIARRK